MERLKKYLRSLTDLSEDGWENLLPALTEREVSKNGFLLKEEEACNSLFYIDKGCCRSYFMKEGIEKNTAFYFENEIATNIQSFGSGEPSAYSIRACEPMKVVVFDKIKLMEASAASPEIELLGRKCIRAFAIRQEEQSNLFQLYTAKERYEYIEDRQPELLQRISLTHLSSYLGVTRETISRIRKKRSSVL